MLHGTEKLIQMGGQIKHRRTTVDEEWSGRPSASWTDSHSVQLDYCMFGPLKKSLCGQRFSNDYEVKHVMHTWLWSQSKAFFADVIRKHINHYTICFKKGGWLCWKWYALHLSQIVVDEVFSKFTSLVDCALYFWWVWGLTVQFLAVSKQPHVVMSFCVCEANKKQQ
jgi:hypothetical protein